MSFERLVLISSRLVKSSVYLQPFELVHDSVSVRGRGPLGSLSILNHGIRPPGRPLAGQGRHLILVGVGQNARQKVVDVGIDLQFSRTYLIRRVSSDTGSYNQLPSPCAAHSGAEGVKCINCCADRLQRLYLVSTPCASIECAPAASCTTNAHFF